MPITYRFCLLSRDYKKQKRDIEQSKTKVNEVIELKKPEDDDGEMIIPESEADSAPDSNDAIATYANSFNNNNSNNSNNSNMKNNNS
jgi:hypothetical protein